MNEKSEVSAATVELAADPLTGDVAHFLIDRLRSLESAYRYLPEDQQKEIIEDAKRAAGSLVEAAVSIIAADGRDTIPVRVKKVVNDGEKIQVTIEARKEDTHRHALFDAAGCAGHLVVADPDKYAGGEMPVPDPDQPELPEPGNDLDEAA